MNQVPILSLPGNSEGMPESCSRFEALQRIPAYWTGRAIGRMQASDCMDLSRDVLADQQAIASYERRAQEMKQ